MSALSTSSSSSLGATTLQLPTTCIQKVETRKTKQNTRQDGKQERITKEEREKGKFNQMTKSQTEARKGHLS